MSEEIESTGSVGSHNGSVDCGGWYTPYDPTNYNCDDSETEIKRERQVFEEERKLEELYASLEHPRVSH